MKTQQRGNCQCCCRLQAVVKGTMSKHRQDMDGRSIVEEVGVNGSVIKATWPNRDRSATYWCPASLIAAAYKAFPVVGEMRVELEIVKTCARRPAGVDHHIKEYL